MMDFTRFASFLKASFPEVREVQLEKFRSMEGFYREWNSKINVISRKDIDGLYDHHVLHSLAIAEYLKTQRPEEYSATLSGPVRFLDLGTGGGFPGIPLAILFPAARFVLCDSIRKKTVVAREAASVLGLDNVTVVNARAESLGEDFDYVVSRAVASLADFYPWVKGRYSKGILYLKGGDIDEEVSELAGRYKLRKGAVSAWPLASWLVDSYFSGKFVIDIR